MKSWPHGQELLFANITIQCIYIYQQRRSVQSMPNIALADELLIRPQMIFSKCLLYNRHATKDSVDVSFRNRLIPMPTRSCSPVTVGISGSHSSADFVH